MGGERASLLALYRRVLRANRTLPPPLRALGDASARSEWKSMRDAGERPDPRERPAESLWHTFSLEWSRYADSLTVRGSGVGGGELSREQMEAMTPEQRKSLAALARAASRASEELLRK